MIETWHQWTCNGCGVTENTSLPNLTKSDVRGELKGQGWKHFAGDLDYCPVCVENGAAARRETSMDE